MQTISPQELHQRCLDGAPAHLIDVRTAAEHAQVHARGVTLIPLYELNPAKLDIAKDAPVYLLCRTGGRAEIAARQLANAGFSQCAVVEGGTQAWVAAGLPVERGTRNVISLERQVRIAAGSLVLTGVLLANFVNPSFLWISAFIGAGLIFAGLTDWCGMGLLLARMPWNRGWDLGERLQNGNHPRPSFDGKNIPFFEINRVSSSIPVVNHPFAFQDTLQPSPSRHALPDPSCSHRSRFGFGPR